MLKTTTAALLCILMPLFLFAEKKKISGTITYYYNQYQGYKPDVGADIYVGDSASIGSFASTIDSFVRGNSYYQKLNEMEEYEKVAKRSVKGPGMWAVSKKIKNEIQDQIDKQLEDKDMIVKRAKDFGVYYDDDYNAFSKRTRDASISFKNTHGVEHVAADGMGNFLLNVRGPGTYYILVVSANRSAPTHAFALGKLQCLKIVLYEDDINAKSIAMTIGL